MRVLFLLPHGRNAAGARYRVHQFIPYLEKNGIECEVREFVTPALYRVLYASGHLFQKSYWIARQTLQRLRDLRDAREFDAFFVYRECYPFGPPFFEERLKQLGKPIIYDFDDAIYLPEKSLFRDLLRNPAKTGRIVQLADLVIVSNSHLQAYCSAYNTNVRVIPTCVDTATFSPENGKPVGERRRELRLGWIGSHSTAKYLRGLEPVLAELARKVPFELLVMGAGECAELERIPGMRLLKRPWSLTTEVDAFRSLDIGLYPLDDTVWELGKAGFKAIQYMAVGVPPVVSRVGVAGEIVREDETGLLATTRDEWIAKLIRLTEDQALRKRLGQAGRQTVVEKYSLSANAPLLLSALREVSRSART